MKSLLLKDAYHLSRYRLNSSSNRFSRQLVKSALSRYFEVNSQCGEYGWFLEWFINDPPKRLCRSCLNLDHYQCAVLPETATQLGLTDKDITNVPTISCKSP
jgi:hypothetical protein